MKTTLCGLLGLLSCLPALALAQSGDAAIRVGESELVPSVRFSFRNTDNAYRQENGETDASSYSLAPSILWQADKRNLALFSEYAGDYLTSSEDSLDYAHHSLRLGMSSALAARHRLQGYLLYVDSTESLVEGYSRQADGEELDELVRFQDVSARFNYTFGARSAKGNIGLSLLASSRNYLNQDVLTQGADYTSIRPGLRFSYRLLGDTRAFVELRQAELNFDGARADRSVTSVLGGVQMDSNRKLSGSAGLGAERTEYDNGTNRATAIAEGLLQYEAASFSIFKLSFDRALTNFDGNIATTGDNATIESNADLTWQYDWNSRFQTTATLEYTANERNCPDNSNQLVLVGTEFAYRFRRWLSFGLTANTESNAVDRCTDLQGDGQRSFDQEYQRNSIGIFLRASL